MDGMKRKELYASTQAFGKIIESVKEIAFEALWPTRCVLCDAPGEVLCTACAQKLPYLDQWQSCPRCGAPFGRVACTECNPLALKRLGRNELPYQSCTSATIFAAETATIVRQYKDGGETRLASAMAKMLARALPPSLEVGGVTFVPATKNAIRRRGFDHGFLFAEELGRYLGKPVVETLKNPSTADQRKLSREERVANLSGSFPATADAKELARLAPAVLIIDDVYTTGSTLCAATDALSAAGFSEVHCATFTRVY